MCNDLSVCAAARAAARAKKNMHAHPAIAAADEHAEQVMPASSYY